MGKVKGILCCLCGLPAAGKTTLARAVEKQGNDSIQIISNRRIRVIVVSFDEVECEYNKAGGEFDSVLWKMSRKDALRRVESIGRSISGNDDGIDTLNQVDESERALWVIIVDDNMQYRRMRYALYQLSRREGIGYATVYLDRPLRDALVLNSKRQTEKGSVSVPPGVIEKMATVFEPPDGSRFSWEKHTVTLHPPGSYEQDTSNLSNFLETALLGVWKVVSETLKDAELYNPCHSKVTQGQSKVVDVCTSGSSCIGHDIDLALRCEMSNFMQRERARGRTTEELKTMALACSAAKAKVLSMSMMSTGSAVAEFLDQLKDIAV